MLNESRIARAPVLANFSGPRQATARVELRLADLDRVPLVTAAVTEWLAAHADVNKALPYGASLAGLTPWSISVGVTAHTTPAGSRRFSAFQGDMCKRVLAAVEEAGAECAWPPAR